MKTFLKMLLATILGGVILFFIGFIILASLVSLADKEVKIADHSILKLDLNNVIYERTQDNPFAAFDPVSGVMESPLGLNEVLASLETAADDDKIIGLYIKGGIPITGHATVTEIRHAIEKFRQSGKFVYAYSEIMTQKGYFAVSGADSIFMNPEGFFEWKGLSSSVAYLQDALNKLGLEPVVLRPANNKFKSAVEPFLRQDMSPENKLQLSELLTNIWDDYRRVVAQNRKLDADNLNVLADSLGLSSPQAAYEEGLLDGVIYEDVIMNRMMKLSEAEKIEDIPFVSIKKYSHEARIGSEHYDKDKIALILAHGDIKSGNSGEYSIGSDRISEAIRKARLNKNVKAIVLRINSPGGSALASEVIWREVALAREEKPVIASFGDYAASGGYYIGCFADTIVAQPTTVTGSIGVFGLFFTGEELMNDKLGINIETVNTNKYSDLGTFDRSLTSGERRMLMKQVNDIYETFLERVSTGRHMPVDRVDQLAGGRVYSGTEAKELGLVDVLGGIDDALAIAANAAGLEEDYRVVEYPELEDPLTAFINKLSGDYESKLVNKQLGQYARYLELLRKAEDMKGIQARMAFDLQID